jgi:toxin CptA
VSNRSDRFECRWQPSRSLLTAYVSALVLAIISIVLLSIPLWAQSIGILLCLLHCARYLRRSIVLDHPQAFTGLRRDASGWQLWSGQGGWQPVQLRPDSMALTRIVVLRYRLTNGSWLSRLWVRSLCIPCDAMAPDAHRRLRLRLKFSRRRWAAPE